MEAETKQMFQGRKFKLGRQVLTCGVNNQVAENEEFAKFVIKSMRRHIRCDWGDLDDEDKQMNDRALERHEGKLDGRLFSAYESKEGLPKIWIITEWDESATTVLFPDEY